jgi:hypothetical protein
VREGPPTAEIPRPQLRPLVELRHVLALEPDGLEEISVLPVAEPPLEDRYEFPASASLASASKV